MVETYSYRSCDKCFSDDVRLYFSHFLRFLLFSIAIEVLEVEVTVTAEGGSLCANEKHRLPGGVTGSTDCTSLDT